MAYSKKSLLSILAQRRAGLQSELDDALAQREKLKEEKRAMRESDLAKIATQAGKILGLVDDIDVMNDEDWSKQITQLRWKELGRDTYGHTAAQYLKVIRERERAIQTIDRIVELIDGVTGDTVAVETVKSLGILKWVGF